MTSFTEVFGGNTVYPSDVSLLPVALTADIAMSWPLETTDTDNVLSSILDVTPNANGWVVTLPDATRASPGRTVLFNNLSGTYNFLVKDHSGATLATIAAGEQWELYLALNTTAAGTWRIFRFGASTATVQPSALAGFGLSVTGATLSQSMPVTTFSSTGLTISTSNRAAAYVWNGAGAGTLNLLAAASAGNNFFVAVRNEGGGNLTIDPNGSETINSDATLVLSPGDSAILITDGSNWYTIGFGQDATFIFDYTSISVTGGTKTLAGSELNRIAYKFVGILTSNEIIVVPSTIQQYWVDNATTGSFTLGLKTAAGTIVTVPQGSRGIYYCDGTQIIKADTASIATPFAISDGGTGAVTASGARLSLGITAFADAIVTATTAAGVRTVIGVAASNDTETLTNKTVSLTSNTLTGTIAQFNTACSDADFATTTGPETLTNKTINLTSNTLVATLAQINAAVSDADLVSLAGSETLTNKTFGNQTVFTHPASSTTGAVIIRDAAGDPGGGYLQWTNNARSTQYGYIRGVNGSFHFSGNIQPVTDNSASCGLVGSRWATVYAATGTINTSDERLKVWRGKLSPAELAAARRIASEIGAYQWRDAIEKKLADGTEARFHIGVRAQRVFSIMDEYWLDWRRYGWCCFDKWDAEYEADGETLIRPAGEMYAIRPDELSFFLIAAQEQRLLALEATASRS